MPGRGPREFHGGGGGDAAIVGAPSFGDETPFPSGADPFDFDDGSAVCGHGDLDLLQVGGRAVGVSGEHEVFVGVFVVHPEQGSPRVNGEEADVVAVVAELFFLGFCALVGEVEFGCAGDYRVAPPHDYPVGVVAGHGDGVVGVGPHRGEVEAGVGVGVRSAVVAVGVPGSRECRVGFAHCQGGDSDADRASLQHATAGQHRGVDVSEVGVAAGVRRFVVAGVTAAEPAGHPGASATDAEERQQSAGDVFGHMSSWSWAKSGPPPMARRGARWVWRGRDHRSETTVPETLVEFVNLP